MFVPSQSFSFSLAFSVQTRGCLLLRASCGEACIQISLPPQKNNSKQMSSWRGVWRVIAGVLDLNRSLQPIKCSAVNFPRQCEWSPAVLRETSKATRLLHKRGEMSIYSLGLAVSKSRSTGLKRPVLWEHLSLCDWNWMAENERCTRMSLFKE